MSADAVESSTSRIPALENGDHLSASEFLRRYEAMPEIEKAELIQGIAFMASPVRTDFHGEPDNLIQTWLGTYAASHPGVRAAGNVTLRLGPDDVPQPDAVLFRDAAHGAGPASTGRAISAVRPSWWWRSPPAASHRTRAKSS